jgi:hypothetical protein
MVDVIYSSRKRGERFGGVIAQRRGTSTYF